MEGSSSFVRKDDLFPQRAFAGEAVLFKGLGDLFPRRFNHTFVADLLGISGMLIGGEDGGGQVPTGPGASGALRFARLDHSGGEVLIVAPRITDEVLGFIRAILQDPADGGVGQRPGSEYGFGAVERGPQGAVDEEEAASG